MRITIKSNNGVSETCANAGETLLDVLRRADIYVPAACGGRGTCGKCRVFVTDASGTSFRLACLTKPADNMLVCAESAEGLVISTAKVHDGGTQSWGSAGWMADGQAQGLGVVIDLGTTTLVCCVVDRKTGKLLSEQGCPNPQGAFGADVISRISACEAGHLETMRDLVRESIAQLICQALRGAKNSVRVTQQICAGNTTMEHILAGIDPSPIGVSPFVPPTLFGRDETLFASASAQSAENAALFAKDSALLAEDSLPAKCYIAPCIAGYVGGDIVAGLVSIDVLHQPSPVLLLDLGTNGEIALGSRDGILACATAAGPVFEGANIKFGMSAYSGAISRVTLVEGVQGTDLPSLEYTVIANTEPKGICGTGLIDALALMLEIGVVDESGYLLDKDEAPSEYAHLLIDDDEGMSAFRLTPEIHITQKDVRSLQLAKSAIYAGIQALLNEQGLKADDISTLYIAGGFGEFLNLQNAARVGLFPQSMTARAKSIGNSCLQGLAATMCNNQAFDQMLEIAKTCQYSELSTSGLFNRLYVEAIFFPES